MGYGLRVTGYRLRDSRFGDCPLHSGMLLRINCSYKAEDDGLRKQAVTVFFCISKVRQS